LFTDKSMLDSKTAAARFISVRELSERLVAPLRPEDTVIQSMPEASPSKWHLAHTTWFFENFILAAFLPSYQVFNPAFHYLFNSYYKGAGEQFPRDKRGQISRPTLKETLDYRAYVNKAILAIITRAEPHEKWSEIAPLIDLGCHHEEQHQELLLSDIKHALYQNPQMPAYRSRRTPGRGKVFEMTWHEFAEGVFEIGHRGGRFGFDCEGPRHKVFLNSFALASRLVTNREYLRFIRDGGYEKPEYWLSDGWDIARKHHWQAPLYWQQENNAWKVFTLFGLEPLGPNEPVCHLSYYEADAYARWAGARLPTEAELEVAALAFPDTEHVNNLQSDRLQPAPGERTETVTQLFGDAWEWTSSAYAPYPGYKTPEGTIGEYNGKFMSGQYVLRGGSCVTPRRHVRASYRNFFYPDARWQFTGLRLAQSTGEPPPPPPPTDEPEPKAETKLTTGSTPVADQTPPTGDQPDADGDMDSIISDQNADAPPTQQKADLIDLKPEVETFENGVLQGLGAGPKYLSSKWLYDANGSELFHDITQLAEYYPTEAEKGILRRRIRSLSSRLADKVQLVEFGCGSSEKVRILLNGLPQIDAYVPIDISRDMLIETGDDIATHYPHVHVTAICADYSKPLELPPPSVEGEGGRLGFFPGSTIGNLSPEEASKFLKQVSKILGSGAGFLIGVDTKKDPAIIEAAYNDAKGVTAKFNLNILERINRELDGNFKLDQFEHLAFYNEEEGRVEMHLASRRNQRVSVMGESFQFSEGETIHTENSYKYEVQEFQQLVRDTGLEPIACWEDREGLFSMHYLRIK